MKTNARKAVVKFKPAYTVDITKCENAGDVKFAMIDAKMKAGQPITQDDIDFIVVDSINMFTGYAIKSFEGYMITIEPTEDDNAHKPWYKRFWNWITRKKN